MTRDKVHRRLVPRSAARGFQYRDTTTAAQGRMYRSIPVIVWAIGQSQPSMPAKQLTSYAQVVQDEAKKHDIDPFTIVAIVHNESRWRASAVSPDGEDFGLGQIRARYRKGCRPDIPAAQDSSPSCSVVKANLLNGASNIRSMANTITAWRTKCRKVTGRKALLVRWLHGYGGMTKPGKGTWCNQTKIKGRWRDLPTPSKLKPILSYRLRLIRLSRRIR